MTTLATLLEQKRELIERLHEDPGPEEREQLEKLLAKINRALDLVDGAGVNGSDQPMPAPKVRGAGSSLPQFQRR
jgi:hypothetical protein